MYIPSMTPSHPAGRASIGLITKFQCGAHGAVFRDTLAQRNAASGPM